MKLIDHIVPADQRSFRFSYRQRAYVPPVVCGWYRPPGWGSGMLYGCAHRIAVSNCWTALPLVVNKVSFSPQQSPDGARLARADRTKANLLSKTLLRPLMFAGEQAFFSCDALYQSDVFPLLPFVESRGANEGE